MLTLPVSYAKYGSGPLAEIIGWIDWKNTYLDIDTSLTDIKVPLENGLTLTFDIKNTTLLGNGYSLNPTTVSSINSPFGTLNYTEIPGNVALQIHTMYPTQSTIRLTLTNIRVTNSFGNPIYNFAFAISNVETATDITTPIAESQIHHTDGKPWNLLAFVGDTSNPNHAGVGSQIVTVVGSNSDVMTSTGAPIITSENPSNLTIDITSNLGIKALSLGIYIVPKPKRGVNLFKK